MLTFYKQMSTYSHWRVEEDGKEKEREEERWNWGKRTRETERKEGILLSSQLVCSLSILNGMHQPLCKQLIFWSQIKCTADGTFVGPGWIPTLPVTLVLSSQQASKILHSEYSISKTCSLTPRRPWSERSLYQVSLANRVWQFTAWK